MIVLGIDTSTNTGGAALVTEDALIGEYVLNVETNHSDRLLPVVQRVLADAQIEIKDVAGIAVVSGPGSFTGLRIGVAIAKGLAYALKKPLIGVTAFEALAWQHSQFAGVVCPIIDARRNQVFTQAFQNQQAITEPINCDIDQLIAWTGQQTHPILFTGDGVHLFKEQLSQVESAVFPQRETILLRPSSVASFGLNQLAKGISDHPFELVPFYMRKSSAEYQRDAMEMNHGQ